MGFLTGVSWEEIAAELLKYSLVDGTRPFTGPVGGIDPVASSDLTTKEYVDTLFAANVSLEYFFTKTASDIGTYYRMQTAFGGAETSFTTAAIGVGNTLIATFATPSGEPGLTELHDGLYEIHLHALVNNTVGHKAAVVYAEVYTRTSPGDVETLIGTSESSAFLQTTKDPIQLHMVLKTPVSVNTTDRIVVKVYARISGTGTNPTVTIYQEGSNGSSFSLPTNVANIRHGILAGLSNDDHTQYALVTGARGFTGNVGIGANPLSEVALYLTMSEAVSANAVGALAYFTGTLVEAASGTHAIMCNTYLEPPTITAGAATTAIGATLVLNGAPSGGTINYCLYSAAGINRLDGGLGVGDNPSTTNLIALRKDQVAVTQINVENRNVTDDGNVQARIRFYNGSKEFMFGLMGQTADGLGFGDDQIPFFFSDTTAPLVTYLNGAVRMLVKTGVNIGSTNIDPGAGYLNAETGLKVGSKAFIFGANDSAGAGYRTVKIENA